MGSRASEGIQVPVRTGRLDLASVTKKIFEILLQEDLSIPVNKSGRPVPHLPRNLTQIGKILFEKKSKFKILTHHLFLRRMLETCISTCCSTCIRTDVFDQMNSPT